MLVKRVTYAGSEFVTGDAIATELLHTSQALAEAGDAQAVTVPAREADGSIREVSVLIGPASQIVAMDVENVGDELIDDDAVARLVRIQRELRPVAGFDTDAPDETDWDVEF